MVRGHHRRYELPDQSEVRQSVDGKGPLIDLVSRRENRETGGEPGIVDQDGRVSEC